LLASSQRNRIREVHWFERSFRSKNDKHCIGLHAGQGLGSVTESMVKRQTPNQIETCVCIVLVEPVLAVALLVLLVLTVLTPRAFGHDSHLPHSWVPMRARLMIEAFLMASVCWSEGNGTTHHARGSMQDVGPQSDSTWDHWPSVFGRHKQVNRYERE
jgi:hypothetical protein